MAVQGKGFFIWKINWCEGGNAVQIAEAAYNAGLSYVLIKVANGIYAYNYDWDLELDLVPPVAEALRSKGIQVWGWHYVYGDYPTSEASIAIRRVQELGLDGYVIDAESEYKEPGKDAAARLFMTELRAGLGSSVPIALSSYRYPSLHPIPWNAFLEKCDYNMPQVYWMEAHNPGAQLEQTLREYESSSILYHPPILPVGAAFTEYGWTPTVDEIIEFMDKAKELNLNAASFWEWYNCREVVTPRHEMWDAIANYDWEGGNPPLKDITEIYIDALNTHDIENIIDLYDERAVHVTADQTIFGKTAIRSWFDSFINQQLPNGEFLNTGYSGSGNSRHFTWVSQADTSYVLDGNDTLGLLDGKIIYHYSYFTLS